MTLIASFVVCNVPILLGDLIISSAYAGETNTKIKIPTMQDANVDYPDSSGYLVSRLRQKVQILFPNLALAWAGSEIAAKTVFQDIMDQFDQNEPRLDEVYEYFESINYLGNQELYVTGIILCSASDKSAFSIFSWDSESGFGANKYITQTIGDTYVGGSGSERFLSVINSTKAHCNNPLESAILFVCYITSFLVGEQMRLGEGLLEKYGGGYEFVTIMNGKLVKFDDLVSYYLQVWRPNEDKMEIKFKKIVSRAYQESMLTIRNSNLLESISDGSMKLIDEVFVVLPVTVSLSIEKKNELKRSVVLPSLDSKFFSFYLHLPQYRKVISLLYYAGDKELPVSWESKDEGTYFTLSPEIINRIIKSVDGFRNSIVKKE